ncbi:MAG: hypothetical protein HQK51_21535, partial [Oligoflexia bacterium]|nr:hypothetical protein [Oligoflexia bacterium]
MFTNFKIEKRIFVLLGIFLIFLLCSGTYTYYKISYFQNKISFIQRHESMAKNLLSNVKISESKIQSIEWKYLSGNVEQDTNDYNEMNKNLLIIEKN